MMDTKTFLKRHPSFRGKGKLSKLVDNPFTMIDKTQIDKRVIKRAIYKVVMIPFLRKDLMKELGIRWMRKKNTLQE